MNNNKVLELLKVTVLDEIANEFSIKKDCIDIMLPHGEIAVLTAIQINEDINIKHLAISENNYVFNHDYGNIGENHAKKLLLRNLQDVKDYAIDVAKTDIIDVIVVDEHVKIANEPILKIVAKIQN